MALDPLLAGVQRFAPILQRGGAGAKHVPVFKTAARDAETVGAVAFVALPEPLQGGGWLFQF